MPGNHKPPVFCDNCSSLALANLDGMRLCAGCLMSALLSSQDPELFDKVAPLSLRGLHKVLPEQKESATHG